MICPRSSCATLPEFCGTLQRSTSGFRTLSPSTMPAASRAVSSHGTRARAPAGPSTTMRLTTSPKAVWRLPAMGRRSMQILVTRFLFPKVLQFIGIRRLRSSSSTSRSRPTGRIKSRHQGKVCRIERGGPREGAPKGCPSLWLSQRWEVYRARRRGLVLGERAPVLAMQ